MLRDDARIVAAYLHGSALTGDSPSDLDIAVLLSRGVFVEISRNGSVDLDAAIPLEIKLEDAVGACVDVQILNRAPLPFRFSVVTGSLLLVDRKPALREEFELLSRVEYFDFRPRVDEYLAGIAA